MCHGSVLVGITASVSCAHRGHTGSIWSPEGKGAALCLADCDGMQFCEQGSRPLSMGAAKYAWCVGRKTRRRAGLPPAGR